MKAHRRPCSDDSPKYPARILAIFQNSNATTRRRCTATRFSVQILRSQLRWLGHILRREPTDPLCLVVFEPSTALLLRLTGTGRKKRVGRPRINWAQTSIAIFCNYARCSRNDLLKIVLDKQSYHSIVERLCSQAARDQQ